MVTRQVQIKSTFHLYYVASVVYNSFNFYLFIFGCTGSSSLLSLVAASRGYSLVSGHVLLIAVAFVVEHRL